MHFVLIHERSEESKIKAIPTCANKQNKFNINNKSIFFPFPAVQEYIQDKLRESNKASKRIVLNCRQRKKKQTCYFKIHFRISGEKKRPPNTHSLPQLASPPRTGSQPRTNDDHDDDDEAMIHINIYACGRSWPTWSRDAFIGP